MKYRAEIDGLRALAVLPVILFHAGFEWFSGGFIGVDVFFVISGYLITTIIISEMAEGKFSIVNFYERRARRILPALFFMMAVCLPLAWLWLIPSDLKDFGQSLVAVSIFSSNVLFWLESSYFGTASELKPLLHTWSLAVEEQFYILFPIFLMLTWRLGIQMILILLSIVFVISLGIAQWGAYNSPSATFYLLPTRGWELLVGVFTAFYLKKNGHLKFHAINQVTTLLGFGMIAYSIIAFDKTTPFPSLYTLIPVIGTGLLIICAVPQTIVNKLLSLKTIVGLGLISYSAYLWHQPILVFARHKTLGEVPDSIVILLCCSSILMAWISWRFIEQPFRNKILISRRLIFLFSTIGIFTFASTGLLLQQDAIRSFSPNILNNIEYSSLGEKIAKVGNICDYDDLIEQETFKYCFFGDTQADNSIIVFGDSHFLAIQYALDAKLREQKIKGIWLKSLNIDCDETIFTTSHKKSSNQSLLNCPKYYSAALDYFSSSEYLILINRWSIKYFYPNSNLETPHFINKALGCEEIRSTDTRNVPFNKNGFKQPSEDSMSAALKDLLRLSASKIKTVVVYPVPEIGCDPYRYNIKHRNTTGSELLSLFFPVEEYDNRNKFVIDIFDEFYSQNKDSIVPVRLRPVFCGKTELEVCQVIENSIPLYFDDDHLSDTGASLVVDEIFRSILKEAKFYR
jgi:peptidoglycan/LPS O-acetylase OafA/YrhL